MTLLLEKLDELRERVAALLAEARIAAAAGRFCATGTAACCCASAAPDLAP